MPLTHDGAMHFDHMRAFARGMAASEVFPRWEEPVHRGFGAPSLSFHPPALYYLTSLLHAAVPSWRLTWLLTDLAIALLSALTLWALVRRGVGKSAALLAAIAFLVFPYRLLDLYQRGALAENLAFAWLPAVWWSVEAAIGARSRREQWRSMAAVGLSYGALVLSHPPTALTFGPMTVLLALGLASVRRDVAGLWITAGGMALGAGLAAFYLLPAAVERAAVRVDVFRDRWAYGAHHIFSPRPADALPEFWRVLTATWLFSAVSLLVLGAVLLHPAVRRILPLPLGKRVHAWMMVGLASAFLTTRAAAPFDSWVPGLSLTSFPWRMLSFLTLVIALLSGAAKHAGDLLQASGRSLVGWALRTLACLVALAGGVFSLVAVVSPQWSGPGLVLREDRPPGDKVWMLPSSAPQNPLDLPVWEPVRLTEGSGTLRVLGWEPGRRSIQVDLASTSRVFIRTFDFPGWKATIDDRPVTIDRGEFGAITFNVPPGRHAIELVFGTTLPRRLGASISWVSVAVAGLLLGSGRRAG